MSSGIYFPICAIPFSIIIIILFYNKGYIKNEETKIYKYLLIINLTGLLIEISCTFASMIYNDYPIISNIIYKSYLVYLIIWTKLFSLYIENISSKEKKVMN